MTLIKENPFYFHKLALVFFLFFLILSFHAKEPENIHLSSHLL